MDYWEIYDQIWNLNTDGQDLATCGNRPEFGQRSAEFGASRGGPSPGSAGTARTAPSGALKAVFSAARPTQEGRGAPNPTAPTPHSVKFRNSFTNFLRSSILEIEVHWTFSGQNKRKKHQHWEKERRIWATIATKLQKLLTAKHVLNLQHFADFWIWSGAKVCKTCGSRKMLEKWIFACKHRLR